MAKHVKKTKAVKVKQPSPLSRKAKIGLAVGFVVLLLVIVGLAFLIDYVTHRDVAVEVNGEAIKKSEIDAQMAMAEKLNTQRKIYFEELLKSGILTPEEYEAQLGSLSELKNRKGTMDSMVDFKIVSLAAKQDGIYIEEDEVIAKEKATIDSIREMAEKGENENIVATWNALETSVKAIDMDMDEYVQKVLGPSQHRSQVYSALKDRFVATLSDTVKKDETTVNQMWQAYLLYLADQVKIRYFE